jgi:hypothetical protein
VVDVEGYYLYDSSKLSASEAKEVVRNTWNDTVISMYTAFLMASKNMEVEPLGLSDLTDHLLKDLRPAPGVILNKEHYLRTSVGYEYESSTLFDVLVFFVRVWKVKCSHSFHRRRFPHSNFIYSFLADIEAIVYDYSKAILIDVNLAQFPPSVLIAATILASIEVFVYQKFAPHSTFEKPLNP